MSAERKSVHVRLHPDFHQRLSLMADFKDSDIAEMAAQLLEKMIVAEFHSFTITAEKMARLGLAGIQRDSEGKGGK